MLAKFHLAEDAFALHLPLQRLERLVDIVVSTKTCTRRSFLIEHVMSPIFQKKSSALFF